MKQIIITLLLLLLISCSLSAQETNNQKSKKKIGITFSALGETDVYYFEKLSGTPRNMGIRFFSFGAFYLHPLNKWVDIETGIEYNIQSLLLIDQVPHYMDMAPPVGHLSLLNIPFTLRINILKYFFLNAGLFLEMDVTRQHFIDNQSGISGLLGIAGKYEFRSGYSIFINPYLKPHALAPYFRQNRQQRIFESGVRIGISRGL